MGPSHRYVWQAASGLKRRINRLGSETPSAQIEKNRLYRFVFQPAQSSGSIGRHEPGMGKKGSNIGFVRPLGMAIGKAMTPAIVKLPDVVSGHSWFRFRLRVRAKAAGRLSEKARRKVVEASTPGQPLVGGTGGLEVDIVNPGLRQCVAEPF